MQLNLIDLMCFLKKKKKKKPLILKVLSFHLKGNDSYEWKPFHINLSNN